MAQERAHRAVPLRGCLAVVTGATSGVGKAIALALAQERVRICLVGRNPERMAEVLQAARRLTEATGLLLDIAAEDSPHQLLQGLQQETRGVNVLVHAAGIINRDPLDRAGIEDLDRQFAINVRAPYRLTQCLLPLLEAAHGQIVFINSSVALASRQADVGQYSATKHALKAIADGAREELNKKNIRVLSLYLGRTATPMQEALYHTQGKAYRPETLLQPEDVAAMVLAALTLPRTAEVTDISIRPMQNPA